MLDQLPSPCSTTSLQDQGNTGGGGASGRRGVSGTGSNGWVCARALLLQRRSLLTTAASPSGAVRCAISVSCLHMGECVCVWGGGCGG
jgi:hypothetical protein